MCEGRYAFDEDQATFAKIARLSIKIVKCCFVRLSPIIIIAIFALKKNSFQKESFPFLWSFEMRFFVNYNN